MSQRNPMNERYREENRGGKTRKSAASAKPSSERAATVHSPAPKSKKQKRAEARERERKQEAKWTIDTHDNKYIESLPEYKKLRRIWWGCLIAAIVLIVCSFLASRNDTLNFMYVYCLIGGYAFVIAAFYIDFGKIRKLRRTYTAQVTQNKSKEARAAQKAARAEARAQQKEAEEKFAAAQAEEEAKKANSPLNRLKSKFNFGSSSSAGDSADNADSGADDSADESAKK